MLNDMREFKHGGERAMARYPGAKHNDCDHYDHKKCCEPKAKKKNGGICDGYKIDCIYWELTTGHF